MLKDITGISLVPGNLGKDCPGNGEKPDVECCCEECDYMLCCVETHWNHRCITCTEQACPRVCIVGDDQ